MIEDRIKILRRAAQVSSRENNEHVWCIIAGNEKLIDDIAYNAITAKDRVQILFRESIKRNNPCAYTERAKFTGAYWWWGSYETIHRRNRKTRS